MLSSERKVAPEELEASHALLRAVLDTAVDVIVTIDHRGNILGANKAVTRVLGYDPTELMGKNVSVLMPEPDRSAHDHYLANYLMSGHAKIIGIGREVTALHKSGALIPVDLGVSEVRLGDRRIFTGILRDMSERYQAEADLAQAEQLLIQNERLAAIGQMVTGLAHESRNALQRSRACLDMLELDLVNAPDQLDWVRRTKSALVELQTLYEEVRNYAAPIKLEKSDYHLTQAIRDVWRELEELRVAKNVELVFVRDDGIRCRIDRQRIGQVIRNIFENSLAVAPSGSRVFVSIEKHDKNLRDYATVRVVDEGPGLNQEQKEKIFEPFFTTKTKGTGLGMAISQRIVEAHGGTIGLGDGAWAPCVTPGADLEFTLPVE